MIDSIDRSQSDKLGSIRKLCCTLARSVLRCFDGYNSTCSRALPLYRPLYRQAFEAAFTLGASMIARRNFDADHQRVSEMYLAFQNLHQTYPDHQWLEEAAISLHGFCHGNIDLAFHVMSPKQGSFLNGVCVRRESTSQLAIPMAIPCDQRYFPTPGGNPMPVAESSLSDGPVVSTGGNPALAAKEEFSDEGFEDSTLSKCHGFNYVDVDSTIPHSPHLAMPTQQPFSPGIPLPFLQNLTSGSGPEVPESILASTLSTEPISIAVCDASDQPKDTMSQPHLPYMQQYSFADLAPVSLPFPEADNIQAFIDPPMPLAYPGPVPPDHLPQSAPYPTPRATLPIGDINLYDAHSLASGMNQFHHSPFWQEQASAGMLNGAHMDSFSSESTGEPMVITYNGVDQMNDFSQTQSEGIDDQSILISTLSYTAIL